MPDYFVEWSISEFDALDPRRAAESAWETMRAEGSTASSFLVKDSMGMGVVVDLHEGTTSDFALWMPTQGQIADLAEWMHDRDWNITSIVEMIRKPHQYADEFSEMIRDQAFDKVAKEPEKVEEDPAEMLDIPVSSLTVQFQPQAWERDEAIDITVDQDLNQWSVSEEVAERIVREYELHKSPDLDFVKDDILAPRWIKEWAGPFFIEVLWSGHPYVQGTWHDKCAGCGNSEWMHDK